MTFLEEIEHINNQIKGVARSVGRSKKRGILKDPRFVCNHIDR